jgi:SAM-dependent methyltransferase
MTDRIGTLTVSAAAPTISPAARAFDAVAPRFDERFGTWLSVAAQRRVVRAALLGAFPPGARVVEIGGGTGEDASWLVRRGRTVLLTDASPTMVRLAAAKLRPLGAPEPLVASAECLTDVDAAARAALGERIDGVFSNFAALNCVADLAPVGRGLARLVRPGGRAVLVVFGTLAVGEWVVQLARADVRAAFRRLARGDVPARLGGQAFTVRYHRARDLARALGPWFQLARRRGVGVCVPPSAAEPWISRHPRLLGMLERADQAVSRSLAPLGDHVLYEFVRTAELAP